MKTAQEVIPTHYETTGSMTSPVPRFRRSWSMLRQLNWEASLVMAKYPGVRLYVMKGRGTSNGIFQYGLFQLSGSSPHGSWGLSGGGSESIRQIIHGIDLGLSLGKHEPPGAGT